MPSTLKPGFWFGWHAYGTATAVAYGSKQCQLVNKQRTHPCPGAIPYRCDTTPPLTRTLPVTPSCFGDILQRRGSLPGTCLTPRPHRRHLTAATTPSYWAGWLLLHVCANFHRHTWFHYHRHDLAVAQVGHIDYTLVLRGPWALLPAPVGGFTYLLLDGGRGGKTTTTRMAFYHTHHHLPQHLLGRWTTLPSTPRWLQTPTVMGGWTFRRGFPDGLVLPSYRDLYHHFPFERRS